MDWHRDGGTVLKEGYLLKTAGGHQRNHAAREKSAKIRYFRLVSHFKSDSPSYVLYYHDTPKAKTSKGHVVISHDTVIKPGWESSGASGDGKASKSLSASSGLSRKSSGSLAAAFKASRTSSGGIAQAIATRNSNRNAMRIITSDRIMFLMCPPHEEGGDSSDDARAWMEAFDEVRGLARNAVIAKPTDLRTLAKVEYDAGSQTFAGVPEQLAEGFVEAAFNLPLTHTTFVKLPGYGDPGVPLVLSMLREFLLKLNGHKEPGIFRIAPDKQECEQAKKAACLRNREDLEYVLSPHVFATLIKQWLRGLPGGLLNQIGSAVIAKAADEGFPDDPEKEILKALDPIRRTIFTWLLDTLALVVSNSATTKMDAKNLGICVAPNLWETDNTGDPMAALVLSQQLCKFVANCLEWRMTTTPPNDPAPAIPAGAVGGPPLNMAPPP